MIAFVSKAVQLVFVLHVTNGDFEGMMIHKNNLTGKFLSILITE